MTTIDDAILALTKAREESPLGGDTVLVVSLTGSEMDEMGVDDLVLDRMSDNPADGALVLVRARLPQSREALNVETLEKIDVRTLDRAFSKLPKKKVATRVVDDVQWTSLGLGEWTASVGGIPVRIEACYTRATRTGWTVLVNDEYRTQERLMLRAMQTAARLALQEPVREMDVHAALSDCVNWNNSPLGDCGGRIYRRGSSLVCETCLNRRK